MKMTPRDLLASVLVAVAVAACTVGAAPPSSAANEPAAPDAVGTARATPPLGVRSATVAPPTVAPTVAPAAASPSASSAASAPDGAPGAVELPAPSEPITVDLYRPGVYAMQATWWWCTAAGVQILRNIVYRQTDHSAVAQRRYFDWMRAHDLYAMPESEGVDLVGLRAGLRHFVDPSYTLAASSTYDAAVRWAVTRLRLTARPAVLIVNGGQHTWLLTGFTATADPAIGPGFRVVSVRIVGPLYGRQSRNGYDPPPDTTLSYAALRAFLLPYHFKFGPTPWDRRFVTYSG